MSAPVSAAFGHERSSWPRRHGNIGGWPPITGLGSAWGDQRVANRYHKPAYVSNLAECGEVDNLRVVAIELDRPEQKMGRHLLNSCLARLAGR